MTKIEWVKNQDGSRGETWNPITGCSKTSPGCKNCYAEVMARRLKAMGQPQYRNVINGNGKWTGHIEFVESALDKPRKRKKPRTYFVNSMSDLLHPNVEIDWLDKIWQVMADTRHHTYQILTKRAGLLPQLEAMVDKYGILPNVWIGVSVENSDYLNRIDNLRTTQAAVRFLSLEPLLGPLLALNLTGIDWVIVGGESGPGARPIEADWVRSIRDECLGCGVPFFFKQWGGVRKRKGNNLLDGVRWEEYPVRGIETESR